MQRQHGYPHHLVLRRKCYDRPCRCGTPRYPQSVLICETAKRRSNPTLFVLLAFLSWWSNLRCQCPLPVRFPPFFRIRRTDGDTALGHEIGSCPIGGIPCMDDLLGMLYRKSFQFQLQSSVVGEDACCIASLIKTDNGFLFFTGGLHAFAPFSEPNSIL